MLNIYQLLLPEVEKYLPTETGEPPLGNATVWAWDTKNNKVVSNELVTLSAVEGSQQDNGVYPLELNTMPGWAGSSQYFNRYMDPHNNEEIFSQEAINYWQQVDLYIGGSEHATGHLLYSRFWQKFMFDKGLVPFDEYAKKLINQGMILGTSAFVYVLLLTIKTKVSPSFLDRNSLVLKDKKKLESAIKAPKSLIVTKDVFDDIKQNGSNILVDNWIKSFNEKHEELDIKYSSDKLIKTNLDISLLVGTTDEVDKDRVLKTLQYSDSLFLEDGRLYRLRDVEKMSKSKYNVVNPDEICHQYGADSLRLYEMFLGPLEQYKPWNTAGITGVHSFLKKLWKLYFDDNGLKVNDAEPTKDNLKNTYIKPSKK